MRFGCLAMLLAACSGGSDEPQPTTAEPLDPPPLAAGVSIDRVELVQAAPVPLVADGVAVPGARPVIAGRPGLLRVHVVSDGRPLDDPVDVKLTWVLADGTVDERIIEGSAVSSVNPDRLLDTANFELDATEISDGASWSVGVYEPEAEVVRTGDHERPGAHFPAPGTGPSALRLAPFDSVLRVFVVPFEYRADGSSRRPSVAPERINALRDHLYKMYPVREVQLEVLDVQPTDVVIEARSGLGDLLEDLAAWRVQQRIPSDAYVYGLVQPADSFTAFCQGGCTIGLSYLASNPNADGLRASVGVGFESVSQDTLVHELGHAHGRRHAPCGNVGGPDGNYPHEGGIIGDPGWDVLDGLLLDSTLHKDFMGYCTPRWVSTYQFQALHEHMMAVQGVQRFGPAVLEPVWTIAMRPGETARLRSVQERTWQPGGDEVDIEVLDLHGQLVQRVQGSAHAFGHGGGGTLLVRDVGGAALRLPDGTVLWRGDAS